MKQKKDIGQIISSKLDDKYNDDFFDESKGWNTLVAELPKKGFWDWGFKHVNVYYVSMVAILLISYALMYVISNERNSELSAIVSPDSISEEYRPNSLRNSPQNQGKKTGLAPLKKNRDGTHTSASQLDTAIDAVPEAAKNNMDNDTISLVAKSLNKPELKLPKAEIPVSETSREHQEISIQTPKDTSTIKRTISKKDTIRRRIKRFD